MASPPQPKKLKMSSSEQEDESGSAVPPRIRYKRRKVAIFLAYCGFGYQGMQKNPGARTIESDLEEALFLSGAVPEPDRNKPNRYEWARSARTDKGVSAAGQVVSGRFYVDPPGFLDRLNSNLSDQIRAFGFKRVTASFSAKKFCDRRRYVYLLPVFALDPSSHPDRESVMASVGSGNELAKCVECSERGRKVAGAMGRRPRGPDGGERSDLDNNVSFDSGEIGSGVGDVKMEEKGELGISDEGEKSNLDNNGSIDSGKIEAGGVGKEEKEEPKLESGLLEENKNKIGIADGESKPCDTRVSKDEEKTNLGSNGAVDVREIEVGSGKANGNEFCYGEMEKERFNRILGRYVGTHNFHNFTTRIKAEDPSARRFIISFSADRVVSIDGIEFVRCEVVGQSFMLHQIRKMIGLAVAMMRNCCPESLMDTALRADVSINVPTAPEVGLYLDECFFTSYNNKWKDSHEEVSMEDYAEQAEEFKLKYIFSHIASMEHKEGAVALWLHSLNHRNYTDLRFQETNEVCIETNEKCIETNEKCIDAEHAQVETLAD
ncbi:uncharacterized protein M6B38_359495 [Iris pallida]|uniref:Pseudouridine synthase I TruA alpha/beta domain-containing protein n=1 Tax=Iris pallida TaxID=29817 RepID=A0AAX6GLD6_IRIPA|nr:uncharacterized protein M6B38_359495 [Iris pallida]